MKKLIIILTVILTILVQCPVYALEINSYSGSNERVSIMDDITVDTETPGQVVAIFGDIDVKADVSGEVVAIFGDITVDSHVAGQVVSIFGKVKLTGNAEIGGQVVSIGSLEKAPGAKVYGQEVGINIGDLGSGADIMLIMIAAMVVFALLTMLVGLIVVAIFKERLQNISVDAELNLGKRIGIGFLAFLGVSLLSAILSIIVLPLLIYMLVLLLVCVTSSIYFGKIMLKAFNVKRGVFLEFVVGFTFSALINIVLLALIPQAGPLLCLTLFAVFNALVYSLGFGMLIDTKFGTIKNTIV